jgi:hypothetical protein
MDRRKALKNVAFLLGTALSSSTIGVLFENFTLPEEERNQVFFSGTDEEILAEFADVIIPTTKLSPGAKAAGVGTFIPMMIRECYPPAMQHDFAKGLKEMESKSLKYYNSNFVALSTDQKQKLVQDLRAETITKKQPYSFFTITRDLTLLGFFSSEIGCTQAREYLPIPGKYDGSAEYKPGQKAWAT